MAKKRKPVYAAKFVVLTIDPKARTGRSKKTSITARKVGVSSSSIPEEWKEVIVGPNPNNEKGNDWDILDAIVRQEESFGRTPIDGDVIVLHGNVGKHSRVKFYKVKIRKNVVSYELMTALSSNIWD